MFSLRQRMDVHYLFVNVEAGCMFLVSFEDVSAAAAGRKLTEITTLESPDRRYHTILEQSTPPLRVWDGIESFKTCALCEGVGDGIEEEN